LPAALWDWEYVVEAPNPISEEIMPNTVVALFATLSKAELAVHDLEEAGFDSDEIGILWPGEASDRDEGQNLTRGIGTGAAAGGLAGGVLAALAAGAVPGIGPVLAGGVLVSVIAGTAIAGSVGGMVGALVSMEISDKQAHYFEQEVQGGRFLVSVTSSRSDKAQKVLRSAGALEAANLGHPAEPGTK
jgi:hypothetical protein